VNVPSNLKYSDTDEWILVEGKVATIGISDYAQSQLSDIVYVEFKVDAGENIKMNSACVTLESVKAAADVNSPLTGKVVGINEDLTQTMEMINSDPYKAWMVKIEITNPAELGSLKDAAAYQAYCTERSH
jgi:glycine cleavage system H protein